MMSHDRVKPARRYKVLVALLVWSAIAGSGVAQASAAKLSISKFTLTPTRTVKTTVNHNSYGFATEPVETTQAGAHLDGSGAGADGLTADIEFESENIQTASGLASVPTRDPKDVAVLLPAGLIGNPTVVPQCPLRQALAFGSPCPAATQVGIARIYLAHGEGLVGPIVNVIPETGQAAEFAIETIHKVSFLLTGHVVRTAEGYGLEVVSNGVVSDAIVSVETTFWGVPASEQHDAQRGLFCGRGFSATAEWECGATNFVTGKQYGRGGEKSGDPELPFITMPANCTGGPEEATVRADSWEEPVRHGDHGEIVEGAYAQAKAVFPSPTACDQLQFNPQLNVAPYPATADSPIELGVDLTVPQLETPARGGTSMVKSIVITLPQGVSITPGAVDGLQACSQSGREGFNIDGVESEELGVNGESQLAAGHCPDASILGTVEAITPLLDEPIEGHLYLARPSCGNNGQRQCVEQDAINGSLYGLYLELGGEGELASAGVHMKLIGKVEANPITGQLTAVFADTPQLPFAELRVRLTGGPRASLASPLTCGQAVTTTDFKTWSSAGVTPEGYAVLGLPDSSPSSYFNVEGCLETSPVFFPAFVAGTGYTAAGKFSHFTINLSRKDGEQYINGLQIRLPRGLVGAPANVSRCNESNADKGTCPVSSEIGSTHVMAGPGAHPFEVNGAVYLTDAYSGAPFGVSIVTNIVAGPFNLGTVVVRGRVDVDSKDAIPVITIDTAGPHALPTVLFGVPLRLRQITVNIDRPKFMVNPTRCRTMVVTAVVEGTRGGTVSRQNPFTATGCNHLTFHPRFTVSTESHAGRKSGVSIDTKLTFPINALTRETNTASVRVMLPKQLSSRLDTLRHACPVKTFESDPSACPSGSVVGMATALTPLLRTLLAGPVYFVAYADGEFPRLILVLETNNLRIDIEGDTFVSKGITSVVFGHLPDVPIREFELRLPRGRFSALAANKNLCTERNALVMRSEIDGQDGVIVRRSVGIIVRGCGPRGASKRGVPRRVAGNIRDKRK